MEITYLDHFDFIKTILERSEDLLREILKHYSIRSLKNYYSIEHVFVELGFNRPPVFLRTDKPCVGIDVLFWDSGLEIEKNDVIWFPVFMFNVSESEFSENLHKYCLEIYNINNFDYVRNYGEVINATND